MKMLARAALLLLALFAPVALAAQDYVFRGDQELYTKAGTCWGAWNGPWSVYGTALRRGVDYADSTTIRQSTFPSQTGINWFWPSTPINGGQPRGYMALGFGDYDAGPVKGCVTPRRLADIAALTVTYGASWSQALGDQNLLVETYARGEPEAGYPKLVEVAFIPRPSAAGAGYFAAARQLGRFIDAAGRSWKVAKAGTYVMFVPVYPSFQSATLDFGGAFAFLRAAGVLTGREWFTGLGFGVEPVNGAGSLYVASLSVDYR